MWFHSYKLKMKHKTGSLIFAHWLIMGRSRKWPDLRSPISKIQDIHFVGTDDLIIFRKFHNFPSNPVAGARLLNFCKVWSLDLTWWPDLAWPRIETFTKVAKKMGDKVGENPAALRAAVFLLSAKNRRGGVETPPAGRRLSKKQGFCWTRCHTLSFKDEDNRKMPFDAEKNQLQNCYFGFLKFWKFWKFGDFFNIFLFLQKIPQNFKMLKTGIYVLEQPLNNVGTKCQVIPFINVVFIAFWMSKWLLFRAYGLNPRPVRGGGDATPPMSFSELDATPFGESRWNFA